MIRTTSVASPTVAVHATTPPGPTPDMMDPARKAHGEAITRRVTTGQAGITPAAAPTATLPAPPKGMTLIVPVGHPAHGMKTGRRTVANATTGPTAGKVPRVRAIQAAATPEAAVPAVHTSVMMARAPQTRRNAR